VKGWLEREFRFLKRLFLISFFSRKKKRPFCALIRAKFAQRAIFRFFFSRKKGIFRTNRKARITSLSLASPRCYAHLAPTSRAFRRPFPILPTISRAFRAYFAHFHQRSPNTRKIFHLGQLKLLDANPHRDAALF
jgi:hypothetical protein